MKVKLTKHTLMLSLILLSSFLFRVYDLSRVGYTTDELVIITAGAKHFLNNAYDPSLYDMATPGGQWLIGLFVTLFSGRDLSPVRDWGMMEYAYIDINYDLFKGLEFYARLPGAIAGIISCFIVYLIGKELYNKKAGLISCALFSFSPILIDYSRVALLEIYQILYTLCALYFLLLSIKRKENKYTYLLFSGVFLGLNSAAKLNGLILIPLSALFLLLNLFVKKRNSLSLDLVYAVKSVLVLVIPSLLVISLVFWFDYSVPLQIYEYYNVAGGAGAGFVLFSLLYDSLFYLNPLTLVLIILSLYSLYAGSKYLKKSDYFCIFLVSLILISGFFEAHASMKRGVQYVMLFFIIISRLFSEKNNINIKKSWLGYAVVFIIITNLILIMYYFPNTALAKSIICLNQDCLDAHQTHGNFDSRIAGEYINTLDSPVVFDTIATTGITGFYVKDSKNYLTGGIAKLIVGDCPGIEELRVQGFTHVIDGGECMRALKEDISGCGYAQLYIKKYAMGRVYDIRSC